MEGENWSYWLLGISQKSSFHAVDWNATVKYRNKVGFSFLLELFGRLFYHLNSLLSVFFTQDPLSVRRTSRQKLSAETKVWGLMSSFVFWPLWTCQSQCCVFFSLFLPIPALSCLATRTFFALFSPGFPAPHDVIEFISKQSRQIRYMSRARRVDTKRQAPLVMADWNLFSLCSLHEELARVDLESNKFPPCSPIWQKSARNARFNPAHTPPPTPHARAEEDIDWN